MTTFRARETAQMIRAYATAVLTECMGDGDGGTFDHLLDAITGTDATMAEACCHMGRALLCLHDRFADSPYRIGRIDCDPRITEIAARLGITA